MSHSAQASGGSRAGRVVQDYGVVIAFALLFLISAIWQPSYFLNPENLRNLVSTNAHIGIIAIGMTVVIIAGGIDLSVGSMSAFVASLALLAYNKPLLAIDPLKADAMASAAGTGVWFAVAACFAIGAAAGLLNGLLITVGRIAPFVATLAGLSAYRSLALVLGDGGEIRSRHIALTGFAEGGFAIPGVAGANGKPLLFTWPIVAFLLVALVFSLLMGRTAFGRHVVAVGANAKAAHYSAISVKRVRLLTYVLLGLCVGLAALIMLSRLNSVGTGSLGAFWELDAIAAVAVGGASLSGGRGRIWGTVVGVLLLGIINNMLILGDVSVYWQGFVKGVIIVLAVLVQRRREDT